MGVDKFLEAEYKCEQRLRAMEFWWTMASARFWLTRKSEREQKWGKGGEPGPGYVAFCMLDQDFRFYHSG